MAPNPQNICPSCGYRGDQRICPRDGFPMAREDLFQLGDGQPDLIGRLFGERYEVEGLIGSGGMGWVFRAKHVVMQQTVALKVLRRQFARDMTAVKRFYREARACSALKHPNTIKVFDFGMSPDGFAFIAMEYLEGAPLSRVLRQDGALAPERAIRIAKQVCKALHEAHDQGLVHRDLKPANIFLAQLPGERDWVKVLDFGIAKAVEGDREAETLTRTGMAIGTPGYMSPEQVRCQDLDRRSDLYSLGAVLFELLTGRLPFKAESTGEMLSKHLGEPAPRIADVLPGRELPAGLAELVQQLLAKERERRPDTAQAVYDTLEQIEHERPTVLRGAEPATRTAPARAAARAAAGAAEPARHDTRPDHRAFGARGSSRTALWFVLAGLAAAGLAAAATIVVTADAEPEPHETLPAPQANMVAAIARGLLDNNAAQPGQDALAPPPPAVPAPAGAVAASAPVAPDALVQAEVAPAAAAAPVAPDAGVRAEVAPAAAALPAPAPDAQGDGSPAPPAPDAGAARGPAPELTVPVEAVPAAQPAPAAVALRLVSQPPGATVTFEGRALGTTPLTVEAPHGTVRTYQLQAADGRSVRRQVRFERAGTVRVRFATDDDGRLPKKTFF